MPRDRFLLLAGAFVRAVAIAFVAVLLGVHLAARGLEPRAIGNVVGAGLAGAGASALLITVVGDRLRRRTWLVLLSALATAGGLAVALASGAWVLGAAAFLGMVNGMGRDRGGAAVLDRRRCPRPPTTPAAPAPSPSTRSARTSAMRSARCSPGCPRSSPTRGSSTSTPR